MLENSFIHKRTISKKLCIYIIYFLTAAAVGRRFLLVTAGPGLPFSRHLCAGFSAGFSEPLGARGSS